MGWIKGTIFCFCIPFLTIYWADGVFAAPGSADCSSKYSLSGSPLIYSNPIRNPPKTRYGSTEKRQRLLNQASVLLKKLSPDQVDTSLDIGATSPRDCPAGDLETVVIQNLVNCLGALEKKNTALTSPTQNPVVISKATYDDVFNQYRILRILVSDSLSENDAENVLAALDDLYDTFKKIINGKLLNVELPNLCSKIMALNVQLEATDPSEDVQTGVDDFIKLLSSALTGQNQVTITAICKCLDELETSVVTITHDGKPEKLQGLISSLINAMINAVESADTDCDVVEIVQKYVDRINEAIQQVAKSRAGALYDSVLNFEKSLSKVLIGSGSTADQDDSSVPVIVGGSQDPGSDSDPSKDASAIVVNGTLFIIKEHVEQLIDDDENIVEVKLHGTYYFINPETEISWTGDYAVQEGKVVSDSDGSVTLVNTGFYDVILVNDDSNSAKRQGVFNIRDNIIVKKDKYGYPERTEYGTYSLKDSSTGSTRTGRFVVTNTISQRNADRSIDITKAGVLFVDDPGTVPSREALSSEGYDKYFLLEEYIFSPTSKNMNAGTGIFNIKNSETLGTEDGSFAIRDHNLNLNSNGSFDMKKTGVYNRDSYTIRVKGYDPAPIISKGSHFISKSHVELRGDKYKHTGFIGTGDLTQTDPKTGKKTSKSYVIFNVIFINNPDGSMDITKFGKFIAADESPSTTVSTPNRQRSSDPTDSARPLLVSKKSFQALLAGLKPVPPNQSPRPQVKPVDDKTNSQKQPSGPTCDDGGTGIVSYNEYNVTSIATDGTFFIINEYITPILDSDGNILTLIKMGTFWFRDEKTNISWSGAFEVTEYNEQDDSPNEVNMKKSGTLEVNPDTRVLCAPDADPVDGFFTLDGYVVTGENDAITITENGTYSLLDTTTNDFKKGRYVVLNNYTKLLDDGVIEVVKTGILFDDPDTKSPSKEISIPDSGRYFIFDDRSSTDPKKDGNKGTGVYSMKDSTTNEQISGVYVIKERTITENPDGTVDLMTVGVIYINGSDFSDTPRKSGSIPSVRTGSTFKSTDHLVTVTDAYGHNSTFGTGTYTQTDPVTGEIQSATYEVKSVVTLTGDDGSTSTLKLGRIPNDAYNGGGEDPPTSEIDDADDTVYCFFKDHVSMTPGNQGNSGTGEYKIDYPAREEFTVGTYDILKRSRIVNSDGSTTWKTSGIIHLDSAASSPSRSNVRLTILDGAQFTMEDSVSYSKDPNDNVIPVRTGIFTQIIPSTGLIISMKYKTKEFRMNRNSDGSQDIIKSGTIDELPVVDVISKLTNPSDSSSDSDPVLKDTIIVDPDYDQVYVSFEDHLFSPYEVDESYGEGKYKIENPSRKEVVVGNYVIQKRSITAKSDGTTQIKKSGVINVDSDQSSPANSDSRLAVLDGAVYTVEEYVSIIKDENDNFIVTGTGLLTQTDSKSGVVTFTNYTITSFSKVNNFDGSQDIVTSGNLLYTAAIADSTRSREPSKSSDPLSKPVQIPTEQDETVSFSCTDLIFGTPYPDGALGTGMFRIDNRVRGEFVTGSYDIYERNTSTSSDGTVNIKTSGVIHLDSSNSSPTITDTRLTIYDGAECVLEETVRFNKEVNGVSVTGNGKLTQTDRNAALITTTNYAIDSYRIYYNPDKSRTITKSGTIQDSSTLAYLSPGRISPFTGSLTSPLESKAAVASGSAKPKSSDPLSKQAQILTEQDETVSFSCTDLIFGTPYPDGSLGTGMFRIDNRVRGEFVTGSYDIYERTTSTSSNGTVNIKTSGVIHLDSSNSSPTITDTRLTFYDGAECVLEETVRFNKEVNGVSVTGNGKLTQTDKNAAPIMTTTYTIDSYRIYYNPDKSRTITKSGTIQDSSIPAYLSPGRISPFTGSLTSPLESKAAVASGSAKPKSLDPLSKQAQILTEQDETVSFSCTDLIFGTPYPDGALGTGMFRIDNRVRGEFVTGSYDIYERTTSTSSNGTVNIKTSGVIHLDSSNSSPTITDTRLTFYDGAECVFEEYARSNRDVNGITVSGAGKLTQTDRNAALITTTNYAIDSYRIYYNPDKSKTITKSGTIQDSSTLAYLSSSKKLSDFRPLTSPLESQAAVASVCVTLPRADVVAANRGNNPKPGNVVIVKTNNGKVLSAKVKDNQSPLTFNLINLAQFSDICATKSVVWNIEENKFSAPNRKLIDAVAGSQPC